MNESKPLLPLLEPRRRSRLTAILLCLFAVCLGVCAEAAPPRAAKKATATRPRDYRSRNFLVHTDLPPREAKQLLQRLETMLRLISAYWGRPSGRIVE